VVRRHGAVLIERMAGVEPLAHQRQNLRQLVAIRAGHRHRVARAAGVVDQRPRLRLLVVRRPLNAAVAIAEKAPPDQLLDVDVDLAEREQLPALALDLDVALDRRLIQITNVDLQRGRTARRKAFFHGGYPMVRPRCSRSSKYSSESEYSTRALIVSLAVRPPTLAGSICMSRAASDRSLATTKPARCAVRSTAVDHFARSAC